MNGFTSHNARSWRFDRTEFSRFDWTFAVNRLTQWVHNAAKQCFAYRNFHDAACTFYLVAFTNICVRTHDNDTYVVFFKVECHTHNAVRELEQFAGHDVF